jgi:hypothetical protein
MSCGTSEMLSRLTQMSLRIVIPDSLSTYSPFFFSENPGKDG